MCGNEHLLLRQARQGRRHHVLTPEYGGMEESEAPRRLRRRGRDLLRGGSTTHWEGALITAPLGWPIQTAPGEAVAGTASVVPPPVASPHPPALLVTGEEVAAAGEATLDLTHCCPPPTMTRKHHCPPPPRRCCYSALPPGQSLVAPLEGDG